MDVTIHTVLYEYDGPMIFAFETERGLWAATLMDDRDEGGTCKYMVAPTTPAIVDNVQHNHITVDALFRAPGPYGQIRVLWHTMERFTIQEWTALDSATGLTYTPNPGIYLSAEGRQP